jgi:ABC-2 type transport system permease protein
MLSGPGNQQQIAIDLSEVGPAQLRLFLSLLSRVYLALAAPLLLMLGVLVFYYCLGALHDERRDRSILFWKSLPVSDRGTVCSKALLALLVAPLITFAISIVTALLIVLAFCVMLTVYGAAPFATLLSAPDLYLSPLLMLGMLPVYMLWALPSVGWLLLVSAWARNKVFPWAVGAPLLLAGLAAWVDRTYQMGWDIKWWIGATVGRALLALVPGSWFAFSPEQTEQLLSVSPQFMTLRHVFAQSWATLGTASLWLGALAGVAMLAGAAWLRRRGES